MTLTRENTYIVTAEELETITTADVPKATMCSMYIYIATPEGDCFHPLHHKRSSLMNILTKITGGSSAIPEDSFPEKDRWTDEDTRRVLGEGVALPISWD